MTDVENSDVMIELEDLTKMYPGQPVPAVDHVNMRIPRGEIVVLVGPSGCGKTTTMKMVNRLIEPTSGRIVLDGEDVTKVNANQLRRRIGYVIQQIGLFPHQTIKQNIATVPKVLGWDKDRIDHRVDELLRTVGMDPEEFRDRYPKELSGGQRQRVGVARAMSVDPDVMLMDEPFGAIDPITRERLQNEFLRVQAEIRKTIIFVTHDIDEAIKMGDRIAILQEQSHIAQFAPPEEILTAPANDFVADFIGSGASLKRLNLTRIRDIQLHADAPVVDVNDDITTGAAAVAGFGLDRTARRGCRTAAAALVAADRPEAAERRPAPGRLAGGRDRGAAGDAGRRAQRDDHLQRRLRRRHRRPGCLPGRCGHRHDHGLDQGDARPGRRVLPSRQAARH